MRILVFEQKHKIVLLFASNFSVIIYSGKFTKSFLFLRTLHTKIATHETVDSEVCVKLLKLQALIPVQLIIVTTPSCRPDPMLFDNVLSEMAMCNAHTELYFKFLRKKFVVSYKTESPAQILL